jgi:hypothetical protein
MIDAIAKRRNLIVGGAKDVNRERNRCIGEIERMRKRLTQNRL